jgi:hypothetical protein
LIFLFIKTSSIQIDRHSSILIIPSTIQQPSLITHPTHIFKMGFFTSTKGRHAAPEAAAQTPRSSTSSAPSQQQKKLSAAEDYWTNPALWPVAPVAASAANTTKQASASKQQKRLSVAEDYWTNPALWPVAAPKRV